MVTLSTLAVCQCGMKKGLSIGRSYAQYTVNELLPLAPHEKVITLFSKAINFVSLQEVCITQTSDKDSSLLTDVLTQSTVQLA